MLARINLQLLIELFNHCNNRVRYEWDAKVNPLSLDSIDVSVMDCSAWTQYGVYRTSGVTIPAGSWNQRIYWDEAAVRSLGKGVRKAAYAEVLRNTDSNVLYVCGFAPGVIAPRRAGHTWFVHSPHVTRSPDFYYASTMECYGGHGVGSRPAHTPILADHVQWAYSLPVAIGASIVQTKQESWSTSAKLNDAVDDGIM